MPSYLPRRVAGPSALDGVSGSTVTPTTEEARPPERDGGVHLERPGDGACRSRSGATVLTRHAMAPRAVASRALARRRPRRWLRRSGAQARKLLSAHARCTPARWRSSPPHRPEGAEGSRGGGRSRGHGRRSGRCTIVKTSTPGRAPAVRKSWLKPARTSMQGADAPGKQELDSDVLTDAKSSSTTTIRPPLGRDQRAALFRQVPRDADPRVARRRADRKRPGRNGDVDHHLRLHRPRIQTSVGGRDVAARASARRRMAGDRAGRPLRRGSVVSIVGKFRRGGRRRSCPHCGGELCGLERLAQEEPPSARTAALGRSRYRGDEHARAHSS